MSENVPAKTLVRKIVFVRACGNKGPISSENLIAELALLHVEYMTTLVYVKGGKVPLFDQLAHTMVTEGVLTCLSSLEFIPGKK